MPDAPAPLTEVAGYLYEGMDSFTCPDVLSNNSYVQGENVVCRGGIVQTRPGSRVLFDAPDGDNFQGGTFFTRLDGATTYVFAVDGLVYYSAAPFTTYTQIAGIAFSPFSRQIAWAHTVQSTDYDTGGNFFFLDTPRSLLIIQDGVTRAAYWDGVVGGQIDPSPSSPPPDDTHPTQPGKDGTKIGLWMCWSNNRLWVSRGNQIFASDLGNPLKFTENTYINEGRAFYLSGECTGIIETPEQAGIICFTNFNASFIQSSIQDRTLWLSTPEFQKQFLPRTGCIAPRSLVTQYGMTWWFSPDGVTNLNAALRQNITSRLDIQDNEMAVSKAVLSPDLSQICGGTHENYLLFSVPFGDLLNRHTWCLDQAVFEGDVNAWNSFWTGWRPVEWATQTVNGRKRVFMASKDFDGKNRVWECFLSDREDNGTPITCSFTSKAYSFNTLEYKRFRYGEIFLKEIRGDLNFGAWVIGSLSVPQQIVNAKIVASRGQIYTTSEYEVTGGILIGNTRQIRNFLTCEPNSESSACFTCNVQDNKPQIIDKEFSMFYLWQGVAGVSSFRIHSQVETFESKGAKFEEETGPRNRNSKGCLSTDLISDSSPFTTYSSTQTYTDPISLVSRTATATSIISQKAADDNAMAQAVAWVNEIVGGV